MCFIFNNENLKAYEYTWLRLSVSHGEGINTRSTIQFSKCGSLPPTSKRDLRQEALKGAAWGPGSVCSVAQQLLDIFICRSQALARNWELNPLEREETLVFSFRFGATGPRQGDNQARTIATAACFVAGKAPLQGPLGSLEERLGSERVTGALRHGLFRCLSPPGAAASLGVWHYARQHSLQRLEAGSLGQPGTSTTQLRLLWENGMEGSLGTGMGTRGRKNT